jgi:hypothetical protein
LGTDGCDGVDTFDVTGVSSFDVGVDLASSRYVGSSVSSTSLMSTTSSADADFWLKLVEGAGTHGS